jgi:ABC-type proline/glycine betaine transport system permease subunit
MTESQMITAIKTASGNEYEVVTVKRDFSNRIETHLATFAITVGLGDELAIITSIRATEWHESLVGLETQIDVQQTIPTAYIFIAAEVTI